MPNTSKLTFVKGDVVRITHPWVFGDEQNSDGCSGKWEVGEIATITSVYYGEYTKFAYVERSSDNARGQFIFNMLELVDPAPDLNYEMCWMCNKPSVGLCVECR